MKLSERFRGYLPVVLDLETGGFDHRCHPLLELSCVLLQFRGDALTIKAQHSWHIEPYAGASIDPASLKVTGIDLDDPKREALAEDLVLKAFFKVVRAQIKAESCTRAIIVAHNAHFDQGFLNAAVERCNARRNPFHPFSVLDTASLAAVAYGHNVLSQACKLAGLEFDDKSAHTAAYDCERTAQLFLRIVNQWPQATNGSVS